jgi:hypothetical protein
MIELPGSFSGKGKFAKTRARTGAEQADVVGYFGQCDGQGVARVRDR